jgi:murein L,D-transpeptidase YafK
MTPRRTHITLAALAIASLVIGVVALRLLSGVPERSAPTPTSRDISVASAPVAAPAATGAASGLAAPFLPGLRGHIATESEPSPGAGTIALVEAPKAWSSPDGAPPQAQAEAPLPPRRPADLASLEAQPAAPLPPARPADLKKEGESAPREPAAAAPIAQEPTATAAPAEPAVANVPLPPPRPRALAALTPPPSASVPESSPVPPAPIPAAPDLAAPGPAAPIAPTAPAAQQLAAHTTEPVLRPAPAEVFNEPERPARFNMGAPAYVRIFKKEGELELWLRVNGRYSLYRTFPICKWSGRLGPKVREADYQSPEGFYSVSARQLNPHSNYHLAFNVGYPNAYDRQNGHTGGLVMVHGNCKSVGCFAMTDKGIEEIYGFVAAALSAGQREVPVHIFPFRMTDAAIARETGGGGFMSFFATDGGNSAQWAGFWRNLKEGYDLFQQTGEPPTAYACGDRYAFGAQDGSCKRVAGW